MIDTPAFAALLKQDPKTAFFISRSKEQFITKSYLLHLLTVAPKPVLSLPDGIKADAVITIEADHLYDVYEYIDKGLFFVDTRDQVPIVILVKPDELYMTDGIGLYTQYDAAVQDKEVSFSLPQEEGTYRIGDLCRILGKLYTVTALAKYRFLKLHPYKDVLGEHTRQRIGTGPYVTYTVTPYVHGKDAAPAARYCTYGCLSYTCVGSLDGDDRLPATVTLVKLADTGDVAPYHIHDSFDVEDWMIANHKGPRTKTTYGLYFINRVILADIFGDLIPYIHGVPGKGTFSPKAVDNQVAKLIWEKRISRETYAEYMGTGYFIGHLAQLNVPGLSRRALGTDPRVNKRKDELFEQYKDQLTDPVVVTKIESELVEMDKAHIRGDSSERYYATSSKAYNETRKKMFLTLGLSPSFVKGAASYETLKHSLADGYDQKDFPVMANEIRRGSYDRGINTAKGGEKTAFIARLLNNVKIVMDDCHSTEGITVTLTEDNIADYYGNTIIQSPKVQILLTADNRQDWVGKTVTIRSVMQCKAVHGMCYTCAGDRFRNTETDAIGTEGVRIGSRFTGISMKAMHFSGLKSIRITDLKPFLTEV